MKNLLCTIALGFFCFGISAQSSEIKETLSLLNSYWEKLDKAELDKAEELINSIFRDQNSMNDEHALRAKADFLTASLLEMDQEKRIESITDLKSTFDKALELDDQRINRNDLLKLLYKAKASFFQDGREYYEKDDKQKAYSSYNAGLELNEIEIKYPQYRPRDLSIALTTAYLAEQHGNHDEAMRLYTELVENKYDRPDIYDSLAELHASKNEKAKAEEILRLKKERYGDGS